MKILIQSTTKGYLIGMSKEYPSGYEIVDEVLYVRMDWMPREITSNLDLDDNICQMAVDGDLHIRHFIEGTARHATVLMLIADLKRVSGPGWAKALKGLAEREIAKEAKEGADHE